MAFSRRNLLLSLPPILLPGLASAAQAGRSQAKRHAKQARKKAKRNQKLARQEVADRNDLAKQRKKDRKFLNQDNVALDKARRRDLDDLTERRQAKTERPVFDANAPADEPKPGIKPVTRGVPGGATEGPNE